MNRYLTIEAAAEALSVSQDTIRRMLPQLGAVDLAGGRGGKRLIRIPEKSLEQYLRDCVILPPIRLERHRRETLNLQRRQA